MSLAATPAEVEQQLFVKNHLGPLICGLMLQFFMMGILTLQTWHYFLIFGRKDTLLLKSVVWVLFFTAAFQTATDAHVTYWTFVINNGKLSSFKTFGWTLFYEPAWTGLMATIAQIFFLHRCYLISKSKIILVLSSIGIAMGLFSSIILSVNLGAHGSGPLGKFSQRLVITAVWLASSAATDVILSVFLMYYLRRSKTGFASTKMLLLRVIRLAFETSAFTATIAIMDLIMFETFQDNGAHFFFQFIVGKAYCHSVIVTLLARKKIGEGISEGYHTASDQYSRAERSHGGVTVTTSRVRVVESDPHVSKRDTVAVDIIPMKNMSYGEDTASIQDEGTDKVGRTL